MTLNKKEAWYIATLVLLFIIISVVIYARFGVRVVNDSARYLEYADNLKGGWYVERHNFWYVGYVLFIFMIQPFADSNLPQSLIIAQYLYSFLAFALLYKTIRLLSGGVIAAFIGGMTHLAILEISIWNSYILCESFYYNTLIVALYFLVYSWKLEKYRNRNVAFAVLFVILTCLAKPTGVALLLAIGCPLYIWFWKNRNVSKITKVASLVVGGIAFVFLLNKMLETFLLVENYALGEIVYAVSTIPQKPEYEKLIIDVPNNLKVLSDDHFPLVRLVHFVWENFNYSARLFFNKIYFFFAHVRPYWSWQHNAYNMLTLLPLYAFAVYRIIKSKYVIKSFAIAFLLFHALTIGLTTVDWDGRFLLPLFPVLIILSSLGINDFLSNKKNYGQAIATFWKLKKS